MELLTNKALGKLTVQKCASMEPKLNVSTSNEDSTCCVTTSLDVKGVSVQEAGVEKLEGDLVNFTVNQYVIPTEHMNSLNPDEGKDLVTNTKETTNTNSQRTVCNSDMKSRSFLECVKCLPKRFRMLTGTLVLVSSFVILASVLYNAFTPSYSSENVDTMQPTCTQSTATTDFPYTVNFSMVNREEWGAADATVTLDVNSLPTLRVIVAHTGTTSCLTLSKCIAMVHSIQKIHFRAKADIGYNFLIGGDGRLYEGRGWYLMGAHTLGYNNGSLGVAFIGTFTSTLPSNIMVQTFSELVALGIPLQAVSHTHQLLGQCQLQATNSPGLALMKIMKSWPHFDDDLTYTCS